MALITSKCIDGTLVIYAEGRIDSSNAADAESGVEEARNSASYESVILDLDKLEYISSAGLRVVLRLRKSEPTLKVVNASTDIYEIFEMTGFTEMIPIEKAYRRLSVDGCTLIGKGAKGSVYRYDPETVIKVYNNPDCLPSIKKERELARRAFVLGVPTAIPYDIVKVGECFGSVFELLEAKSLSQLIEEFPADIDKYVKVYAEMLKLIHSTIVKETDMPDIKPFILQWLDVAAPHLDASSAEKLRALIKDVPDTHNMLHCDYHTNNILMHNDEALLIDMDTLSYGHPIFELANVYITYIGFGEIDKTVVEKFIGLPYETATEIWNKFIPIYLGTDDKARIAEVEKKIKLVSYLRLLRHTVRRGINTENDKLTVELCQKRIPELLAEVDTLDF